MTIGVVGILVGLLLPAIDAARSRSLAVHCISNLKQLQLAWDVYVDDFRGALPPNNAAPTGGVWRSSADSWIGPSNAAVDSTPAAIEQGVFWRGGYSRSLPLLRCPADKSRVNASRRARTRSFSMNGNAAGRTNENQRVIQSQGDVADPARFMVFIDEEEDSIDDGHFLVWPDPDSRWVNLPAARHGRAGHWSCADGHVQVRHWREPKSFSGRSAYWKEAAGPGDLEDLRFLQTFTLSVPGLRPPP